jgi:hypothetical protein
MRGLAIITTLALLGSVGCDKKEAPPPAVDTAAATPTPAPATAAPEASVDASSLPVEEQFEADAEQEITTANLEQKLDELEKEIGD